MKPNVGFTMRKGTKLIRGIIDSYPGKVVVIVPCEVYKQAVFTVDEAAATELFSPQRGRCVQDIVPNMKPEFRECFVSGKTPAEWDELFTDNAQPKEHYGCYDWMDNIEELAEREEQDGRPVFFND
jgi:hypothetical protein